MEDGGLREYVERSQSLIEQSPQMNEDNTKARLIEPLIEKLGWDLRSLEVEREYTMQIGSGQARADYALLLDSTPVVFVEAKGCDGTLSERDERQLSSYMRQVGVDWGLLTNGKTFVVSKRRTDRRQPDEAVLGQFSLEELVENRKVIQLISKESVRSGESDKIARRLEASQRAVKHLRTEKSDIADEITDLVTEQTDPAIAQTVEPLAKEFIDGVVERLETEGFAADRQSNVSSGDSVGTAGDTESEDAGVDSRYEVVVQHSGCQKRIGGGRQGEAMVKAVGHMITDHDLVNALGSLPYVPGSKRAVLNDKPVHPDGEEMRLCGETESGHFVYTSLNSESKQRHIRRFAEATGGKVSFHGDW